MVSNLENVKQLNSCRGARRDLSQIFFNHKNGTLDSDESDRAPPVVDAKSRFLVKNKGFAMVSPDVSASNDKGALLPTSTKASSDDSKEDVYLSGALSMPTSGLCPEYVDIQEEIENNLEEIDKQMKNLKQLHTQRIKNSFFGNAETMQIKTIELTRQITNLIKKCDMNLKELSKVESSGKSDDQIRKNMQTILASRLKTVTFELRKMEKDHYMKVQELHGDASQQQEQDSIDDSMAMEQDMEQVQTQHRSKEINQLADSINSLAVLFKDFSVLVIEQGTILDRIDYNVENAVEHVEEANVHLEKTLKIEKSTRARSCMICLAIAIFVMMVLLVIKWS